MLLDMAYPPWKVAVEFDGWQFHQGRGAFDRDRRRRNELLVAGWAVLVVTSNHSRSATVRGVRDVLVSRGWSPPG